MKKPAAGNRNVNRSMRTQMTLGFTIALAILLLLTNISLVAYSRYSMRRNWELELAQAEQSLRSELSESVVFLRQPQFFVEEESREMQALGVSLLMLDEHDRVLFAPKELTIAFKKNGEKVTWPLNDDIWHTRRISWNRHFFILALSSRSQKEELYRFAFTLTFLSFIILSAASAGAWFLVGRTLAPLEALSQQALSRQSQSNSLGAQAPLQSPSNDWEMTHLVSTINGLLARTDADMRAKARFYAAASHELRTPLQSLSGFLELGLSRERSQVEYRDALQEAHAQSRDLITLVNDLLTLNQLENVAAPVSGDEVDVADVVERTLQRLQSFIGQKHLVLSFESCAPGVLHAPWSHVEMLLRNLLENAVKYAANGGRLSVSCEKNRFEVFNECAPTAGWDDEKIFEPFFRPDASRNSQTGGNGLGLAICKAICEANNWQLHIKQTPTGVRACIRF